VWGIWNLGFKEVLVRWVTCTQNFSYYGSALAISFPVSPFFSAWIWRIERRNPNLALLQSKDQAWFIFLPCGFLFISNQFGSYLGDAEPFKGMFSQLEILVSLMCYEF
jgi:hypothetical protein